MDHLIAITGVTGAIGGGVARKLAATGHPLRLIARQPERVPDLPGCEVRTGEYGDQEAMRTALDGASTMLLVSGREAPDRLRHHQTAINAAMAAGVERMVYTSFLGAAAGATFTLARQHWHTEQHIRASGMGSTFLRNSIYMDMLPHIAGPEGTIRAPAADGRVAFVARDDIVDVAAIALLDPSHEGRTYKLTGPAALNLHEVADLLSRFTGRDINYHAETEKEAYESRAIYSAPAYEVEGWVTSYLAIANGEIEDVSDDVERVSGHPPMSLATFLERQLPDPSPGQERQNI